MGVKSGFDVVQDKGIGTMESWNTGRMGRTAYAPTAFHPSTIPLSQITRSQRTIQWIACLVMGAVAVASEGADIPCLRTQGTATQLVVDGKPFLILGGELGNSSASDLAYMEPIWPKLVKMNLNTVLAPVYWDRIEPEEAAFDFTLVDGLIEGARAHGLRLVLLWFGSWKNSMSCYAPLWVKTDQRRFPRAQNKQDKGLEILSPFREESRNADARAFTALMRHVRQVDGQEHTVIMVQVENEIGMIPDARDHSDAADARFAQPVPRELMDYLQQRRDALMPEFQERWEAAGARMSGGWQEVFGPGLETEEIFMAWHFARYVEHVAKAGKAEYALPMFVNAALIRPNYKPGQYPSGGPLPHLMDVWRAGAPSIDFLSPDIYFPNFAEWCDKYHRSGNPLFIPEAGRGSEGAVNVFYAMGQHDAMGFCPFSIESTEDPANEPLARSYDLLAQLTPLILESQGKGLMAGVLLDKDNPTREIDLGDYTLKVSHDYTWGWSGGQGAERWPQAGGMIISTGPDEYTIAGSGIIVTFAPNAPTDPIAGIGNIQEGRFVDGRWVGGRWMNGDQSHQGRHLRIGAGDFGIQRVRLYRYR
jgi:beta-galactosidase GanA